MHTVADLRLISAESDAARGVCAPESSSYNFVGNQLATKVFIGKLLATRGVEVIIG